MIAIVSPRPGCPCVYARRRGGMSSGAQPKPKPKCDIRAHWTRHEEGSAHAKLCKAAVPKSHTHTRSPFDCPNCARQQFLSHTHIHTQRRCNGTAGWIHSRYRTSMSEKTLSQQTVINDAFRNERRIALMEQIGAQDRKSAEARRITMELDMGPGIGADEYAAIDDQYFVGES